MVRFLSAVTLMTGILCCSLAPADEPARQIDPEKLEKLKEKLKNLDPEKLKELKEKFGGKIDPAKLKELRAKQAGAAPANVDLEALFKKYDADKDGKLALDELKKLYDELKTQMGPARPGVGNLDPEKLKELKEKLKNKQ